MQTTTQTAPAYRGSGLFTPVPQGNENQDQVFMAADTAMSTGRFVDAQRDFGTLYLLNPGYRGGVPLQAINQTCVQIGNDCGLLFSRLNFIRDAMYGQFGLMNTWAPAQSQDFGSILTCYEASLQANWSTAVATGQFIAQNSPLPGFRTAAEGCVNPAQTAMSAQQQQQAVDAAFATWDRNYNCMEGNRVALKAAGDQGDWERWIQLYPPYQTCADPLMSVIDSGVLEGNPIIGNAYDLAWSNMSEIEAIAFDNEVAIEQTRAAQAALANNAEYGSLRMEMDLLAGEEQRIRGEMAPLEASLNALSGSAAVPLQQRLSLLQGQLAGVESRRSEVLERMNAIRAEVGVGQ
jgi:hypothetical protein